MAGSFVLRPDVGKVGSAPLLSLLGPMSRRAVLLENGLRYVREGFDLDLGPVSFFRRIADVAVFFSSSSTKYSAMTAWSLGMIWGSDSQRKLVIPHTITFNGYFTVSVTETSELW